MVHHKDCAAVVELVDKSLRFHVIVLHGNSETFVGGGGLVEITVSDNRHAANLSQNSTFIACNHFTGMVAILDINCSTSFRSSYDAPCIIGGICLMNVNVVVAKAIQYAECIGKTGTYNTSDNLVHWWGDIPCGIRISKTFDVSLVVAVLYLDFTMFAFGITTSSNNTTCVCFDKGMELPEFDGASGSAINDICCSQ